MNEIVSLCHDNDVDILLLAESKITDVQLLKALNQKGGRLYIAPFNPSVKIQIFIRYPLNCYKLISDDGGIAIRQLIPPIGKDIIIVALHLQSKLHMKENEQIYQSVRIASAIEHAEQQVGHSRTLVIGDFNMNPFEDGIVGADGFHAVMDKVIAKKVCRTVQGKECKYFYNPMWSRMGDSSPGPPGTYYYSGGHVSYFWNTFDQILLRPDLLDYFSDGNWQVLTKVGDFNLLSDNIGIKPSTSDHLPIIITLDIERGM